MTVEKKAKIAAVLSIVFGIIGIPLGPLFCIFAVIEGEYFRKWNKQSAGALKGKNLAIIGTTLGIVFLVFHGINLIMMRNK